MILCFPEVICGWDNWTRYIDVGSQGTDDVCAENGEQIMYQSYAAMQVGDGGITLWEENGHTNMCSVAPTVVYNDDGTINGDESWLCIIEQGAIWEDGVSAGGIPTSTSAPSSENSPSKSSLPARISPSPSAS